MGGVIKNLCHEVTSCILGFMISGGIVACKKEPIVDSQASARHGQDVDQMHSATGKEVSEGVLSKTSETAELLVTGEAVEPAPTAKDISPEKGEQASAKEVKQTKGKKVASESGPSHPVAGGGGQEGTSSTGGGGVKSEGGRVPGESVEPDLPRTRYKPQRERASSYVGPDFEKDAKKKTTSESTHPDPVLHANYLQALCAELEKTVKAKVYSTFHGAQLDWSNFYEGAKATSERLLTDWFWNWSRKMDDLEYSYSQNLRDSLASSRRFATVDGNIHVSPESAPSQIISLIESESGDVAEEMRRQHILLGESCAARRSEMVATITKIVKEFMVEKMLQLERAHSSYGRVRDDHGEVFSVDNFVNTILAASTAEALEKKIPAAPGGLWWRRKVEDIESRIRSKKSETKASMEAFSREYLASIDELRNEYRAQQERAREAARRAENLRARQQQAEDHRRRAAAGHYSRGFSSLSASLPFARMESIVQAATNVQLGQDLANYQKYALWKKLTGYDPSIQTRLQSQATRHLSVDFDEEDHWLLAAKYLSKKTKVAFGFLNLIWEQVEREIGSNGKNEDGDIRKDAFYQRLQVLEQSGGLAKLIEGLNLWCPVGPVGENVLVDSFIKAKHDRDGTRLTPGYRYTFEYLLGKFN